MNLQAMGLLAKYPKLVGLADMATLKANQLTTDHLVRVADAFGAQIPITQEISEAIIALFKGHDINVVADMIQSPEALNDLIVFFTGGFRSLVERAGSVQSVDFDNNQAIYIA